MNSLQGERALWIRIMWGLLTGCLVGCGDPIYDSTSWTPPATNLVMTSSEDSSRYQWPQTRDGYFVAKPPQMAYVTSFDSPIVCPDPVSAKLVPWSTEGLDPEMLEYLEMAYKPMSLELEVTLRLENRQLAGPQAFDVSSDGTRLVVVHDQGLTLYDCQDGSVSGHLPLPEAVATARPRIDAVRFCGKTQDMLVASTQKIFRIRGSDGSLLAETQGCGEPIAQWMVTDSDQAMLIRSQSGRLFGGDPQLEFFTAYDLGQDMVFDATSLSPDGTRIGVVVDGYPRTYIQDGFRIVNEVDYKSFRLDPTVSVSSGPSSDAWVDADGIVYTTPNPDGSREVGGYRMLWKPIQISMASETPGENFYLTVGKRFVDEQEQYVMFDFGPIGRSHSLPKRLDELPVRFAHSLSGHRVAILDSRGLRLCKREPFRRANPLSFRFKIYNWVDQKKFADIEKLLAIIKTQDRLGFGLTAESLRSDMIREMAARWMYLHDNDPDGELIKGLQQWREEGSQLSMVVNGVRHYRHAWNARGRYNGADQQAWDKYTQHMKLCSAELDKAFAMSPPPPLVAFDVRINARLESSAELAEVDEWCRQATELYPTELRPHYSVCFKLLPQWKGEYGDALSFAESASRMFAGAEADYKYMRLTAQLTHALDFGNSVEWRSYNSNRIRRGVDEALRRRANTGDDLWMLWMQLHNRTRNTELADQVLKHLMANRATLPSILTEGSYALFGPRAHERCEQIRSR